MPCSRSIDCKKVAASTAPSLTKRLHFEVSNNRREASKADERGFKSFEKKDGEGTLKTGASKRRKKALKASKGIMEICQD